MGIETAGVLLLLCVVLVVAIALTYKDNDEEY